MQFQNSKKSTRRLFVAVWQSHCRRILSLGCNLLAGFFLLLGQTGQIHAEEELISIDKRQLQALINQLVDERIRELGLSGEQFDKRVFEGVEAYIRNAQQAQAEANRKKPQLARAVSAGEHIFGNSDAEFSIIEYSDFECPFCKRYHDTPKALVDKYPEKINWVYRHLPLSFHNPGAQKQAEASECVAELGGNRAFWAFSDLLYARTRTGGRGFALNKLLPLAEEVGIDATQFKECYDSERHRQRVENDAADAAKAGITGTPGTILRHNPSRESRALDGAVKLQKLVETFTELSQAVSGAK